MLVYPTIAVVQARHWGLPVGDLLTLATPGFMLFGLMALPFGAWADRAPGSLPVVVGLVGMGAGSLFCATASEGQLWHIAVGLGLVGAFAAAYHPAGLGIISHGIPRREWALGVNGVFGTGGVAVAPGLAEVLSETIGWRGAFVALGIPALVIGAWYLLRPIRVVPGEADPPAASEPARRLWSPNFFILCIGMTVAGLAYRGVSVVLPTLFDQRVEWLGHGIATSMVYSLAAVMNYVGGHLAERFSAPKIYFWMHAASFPWLVLTADLWGFPLLVVTGLYAACALGMQPAENTLVGALSPPDRRGVAYGVKFTLAFGIGSLSVPLVSHLLATVDTTGVMLTLSGFSALVVLTAAVLERRLRS